VDSIFKTLSRVECSPVSVRPQIIHHNISVCLTNTNNDLLLRPDVFYFPPLGSASWCTRYGSARKRTYSIQRIFLFPKQNGHRFDWRPSGVGVPCCSARSFWALGDQKYHGDLRLLSGPRGWCSYCWDCQYLSVMVLLDGWQLCWSSGHQNDLLEVGVP
jgi:hypothetical protein